MSRIGPASKLASSVLKMIVVALVSHYKIRLETGYVLEDDGASLKVQPAKNLPVRLEAREMAI